MQLKTFERPHECTDRSGHRQAGPNARMHECQLSIGGQPVSIGSQPDQKRSLEQKGKTAPTIAKQRYRQASNAFFFPLFVKKTFRFRGFRTIESMLSSRRERTFLVRGGPAARSESPREKGRGGGVMFEPTS